VLAPVPFHLHRGESTDVSSIPGKWAGICKKSRRGFVVRQCLLILFHLAIIALCTTGSSLKAQSCTTVVCENQQAGNTDWQISGAGDSDIQGFATDISVNVGGTISFKINTTASNYHLDIYRMGYYGGAGARKVATVQPSVTLPQTQPACLSDAATHLLDCGNWAVSASWTVPSTAISGVYFAHLIRPDNGDDSQIFWVVRNDASHSDILFQTSDQTWAAYNDYGGHSLYGGPGTWDLNNRAFKVSYNRPYDTRNFEAASFIFNAEYPMIRWLEANGYDVSYFTGVDAVRNPSLIRNHKLYLSVGHDEYVSTQARANIQAARDTGVNLAYFSGNEVFWKTRWENSIDGTNTPYRTMVCYKETYYGTGTTYVRDPLDPNTWTGTWADSRFSPPSDGAQPQNALTGTLFAVNGPGTDNSNLSINVTAEDGKMRFWRNTSIANLGSGQVSLPAGTLGYEWDADIDNGFRPAGAIPLSTSTYTLTTDLLLDFGATYGAGNATHHLVLYRAASGALVFGAGTVQWSWGLDNNGDGSSGTTADLRMQQATVNLFADMGIQPGILQTGLIPATKSTDTTPPTAVITGPSGSSNVAYGNPVTVTGTASDAGGGVVGAVEVSIDGGQTWHPATGRSQWSYSWSPWGLSGAATIMARAIDDSLNIQSAPATATVNVTGIPSCPCSIWPASATPGTLSANDSGSVELGVRFRSDVAGYVGGVRFYKGTSNTGTHVGNLWTSQGTKLATVTFTNETMSGWQQASFPSPVLISGNTPYVISYYAPNGGYADDEPYFTGSIDKPPLHALADQGSGGNGLFKYVSGGGFPIGTFNSANYWVDVVFTPSTPWSISGTISGGAGATVSLTGPSGGTVTADSSENYTFNSVLNGSYTVTPSEANFGFTPSTKSVTVTNASVSGVDFTASALPTYALSGNVGIAGATVTLSGSSSATMPANASGAYSFTLANGTYTITPSLSGYIFSPTSQTVIIANAPATGVNFTPVQTFSIWPASTTPGTPSENDPGSVELGVKFQSSVAGSVLGIRFYKGSGNTGTHIGNLWDSSGTKMATATFTNETATGWQQVLFSSPVSISAKTTYVASYFAPAGGYAADSSFFSAGGVSNPPLQALANSVSADGVYAYGNSSSFPSSTYQSTNYWVDVVFAPASAAPTFSVSGTITGGAGATVNLTGPATASTTADPSGNYAFTGLANGSYTVTPSKSGLVFNPFSAPANVNGGNVSVNFTASAAPTFSISGTITGGATTATVALSGTATATTTVGQNGNFSFSGLANGTYTLTPSQSGYTFSPASSSVTVNNANVTGVIFATIYSISGTITGGGGATVALSGAATATTTADPSGNYIFAGLANGSYTVTPSKSGLVFTPASQSVTVAGANISNVNFATPTPTFSISGTITGGATTATVALSGPATATTTVDQNGNYSFSGLASGSYTVTPSQSGYTFSPASASVTVNGANGTANFTATATTKPALSIDANVSTDQNASVTTVTTSAFSTTSGNELLLAFISSDQASNSITVTGVTGGSLTWALVKRTNTQKGTAEIWRAFSASSLTNVTVTATLSQSVASLLTVLSFRNVDTSGTSGSGAIGATGTGNAASGAPKASLVTTRNNSWVIGVGNDYDNATARTLGSGQTLVHQDLASSGDTYWVQMQTTTTPVAGTTVTINDTAPTGDRYNLTICEVLPAP
jgi:hypothetical protein